MGDLLFFPSASREREKLRNRNRIGRRRGRSIPRILKITPGAGREEKEGAAGAEIARGNGHLLAFLRSRLEKRDVLAASENEL